MARKIIGIGETVLDIIFRNDRPEAAIPGGSTFNAMISLGRTAGRDFPDTPLLMVTETGDDHVGDIVTSFMERNGVSTAAVTRNPGSQTHISLAFLDDANNAQYEFYKDHAAASLEAGKLSGVRFRKDDLVLFGSYFAINPKLRTHTARLLQEAHDAGAILYYDVNFRSSHLRDLDVTMGSILDNCALCDFVRGSDEDFGILFGTDDPERIYSEHIAPLCPNFICTCGSEPVHVFAPGIHLRVEAPKVETVSTIGAGDSFNAGFIYALLAQDVLKEDVRGLGGERLGELVRIAGLFAANTCRSIYNYVDEGFKAR